jgi:hypothetical protein
MVNQKPSQNIHKLRLAYFQLFIAVLSFLIAAWIIPSSFKLYLLRCFKVQLSPWASIFFNYFSSKLLNYIFLSAAAFLAYLFISSKWLSLVLQRNLERLQARYMLLIALGNIIVLAFSDCLHITWIMSALLPYVAFSILYLLLPFKTADKVHLSSSDPAGAAPQMPAIACSLPCNGRDLLLGCLLAGIFMLFCSEVLNISFGRVLLMNEYQNIYSHTLLPGGREVDNLEYLSREANKDGVFADRNTLEYIHQNMTRGQIDHISYIINPINEYSSGKSLKNIYFQYGTGNTILFGWLMRIFGSISIQNYYKCYCLYLVYALLFVFMLVFIFREFLSSAGACALHFLAFFCMGFNCFILAPGIIPSIHLLDAPLICVIYAYLISGRRRFIYWAMLLSAAAVVLNNKFGGALSAAALFTLFHSSAEKTPLIRAKRRVFLPLFLYAAVIAVLFFFDCGRQADPFFKYYLLGLYSFRPPQGIITFTFMYLLISYTVIYALRNDRSPDKYLFAFLSVYSQFLLLYFYWSGLTNHFPMALQFIGVQFFLMLRIIRNKSGQWRFRSLLRPAQEIFVFLAAAAAVFFVYRYYFDGRISGRQAFYDNFRNHRVYSWKFPRARLSTTIPNMLIGDSISLIKRYASASSPGIYIISKYDNLLPFLSGHYSLMPHFCMSAYLFTQNSSDLAVSGIITDAPRYIFVDSDIESAFYDPWEPFFLDNWSRKERASRFGRYHELRKVFLAIKKRYEKLESGGLLTVYKRKDIL